MRVIQRNFQKSETDASIGQELLFPSSSLFLFSTYPRRVAALFGCFVWATSATLASVH